MKAILDNNLSPRIAIAPNVLVEPEGHRVLHLREKFPESTVDTAWITALGREGDWVIISEDRRIFKNRHEREAWRQSGLTAFFLAPGWRKMKNLEKAQRLLQWWPRIVEQVQLVESGAAFEVPVRPRPGRFRQLRS